MEAIRAAARGEPTLHPKVAARLLQESRAPHTATELTPRETDVLKLIAEGLSNADIAARLVLSEKNREGSRQQYLIEVTLNRSHPSRRVCLA